MIPSAEKKFVEFLQERDLKYTQQRRTILREALKAKNHFTADEFLEIVKREDRTISKATLYRTLILLTESGILEEHDFGNGRRSYEQRAGHGHHDHLICVRCQGILEFQNDDIEKIQERVASQRGFRVLFHSHKLFGLCRKCVSREAGAPEKKFFAGRAGA